MTWKIAVLTVGAVLLSGCLMPRSAGIGQTADMLRKGQAEIGLSPGLVYQSASQPGSQQGTSSSVGGLNFPMSEGNAAYGLSETLGLNLHISPAGLQPGVKFSLMRGAFDLAVMPSVAIVVYSQSSGTTGGNNTTSTSENYLGLMAGVKLLGSHRTGFYGGIGYDIQSLGMSATGGGGGGGGGSNTNSESTLSHNLSFGAGYEAKFGAVRIRPELALMFSPGMSTTVTSGSNSTTRDGGSGFYFFPNVTIAVVGGSR